MHSKKNTKAGEAGTDAETELRRLIQEQRRDADSTSVARTDRARSADPLVTRDGAIRSHAHTLRDLVAPAPDELLTRPPEEDADAEPGEAAPSAEASRRRPGQRGRRSSRPSDPSSGPDKH